MGLVRVRRTSWQFSALDLVKHENLTRTPPTGAELQYYRRDQNPQFFPIAGREARAQCVRCVELRRRRALRTEISRPRPPQDILRAQLSPGLLPRAPPLPATLEAPRLTAPRASTAGHARGHNLDGMLRALLSRREPRLSPFPRRADQNQLHAGRPGSGEGREECDLCRIRSC